MADKAFVFTSPVNHDADHTARLAVLWPLAMSRDSSSMEAQLQGAVTLMKKWRTRLNELRDAGWNAVEGKNIQYMRNCYPSMVMTDLSIQSRCCRRKDVCPWCYGRLVSHTFRLVYNAQVGGERLTSAIGSYYYPITGPQAVPIKQVIELSRTKLTHLARANAVEANGMFTMVTVEPSIEPTRPNRWKSTCRLLAYTPKDVEFDLIPHDWEVNVFSQPSVEDVKRAVYRSCRYPEGMLRGKPEHVVEALHARDGLRLVECYKSFRTKHSGGTASPEVDDGSSGGRGGGSAGAGSGSDSRDDDPDNGGATGGRDGQVSSPEEGPEPSGIADLA